MSAERLSVAVGDGAWAAPLPELLDATASAVAAPCCVLSHHAFIHSKGLGRGLLAI
jgi:hypothetical protein